MTAVDALTASAGAEIHRLLPELHARIGLYGTVITLLGRELALWGEASAQWARRFARGLARVFAGDDADALAALEACAPLAPGGAASDARAFVAGVPTDANVRTQLLAALLVVACATDYDARARRVLQCTAVALGLGGSALREAEAGVAACLLAHEPDGARVEEQAAATGSADCGGSAAAEAAEDGEEGEEEEEEDWWRLAYVGGAALLGGVLIAATAGLAAPALGIGLAAVGGLGGGALGTAALAPVAGFLASAGGLLAVKTALFATGAGLGGYRMHRLTDGLAQFEFVPLLPPPRDDDDGGGAPAADARGPPACATPVPSAALSVQICVASWRRCEGEDVRALWTGRPDGGAAERLQPGSEHWLLRWEEEELVRLGVATAGALESVADSAGSAAAWQLFRHTALAGVLAAVALPAALISASALIDNPWAVAQARADKAGAALARALLARAQGGRPVSLTGYSLGARLVLRCLEALDAAGEPGRGLVSDAVLLGTPEVAHSDAWPAARRATAGALVNGYARDDLVLACAFRAHARSEALASVSGLAAVEVEGVLDVDLTDLVPSHAAYSEQLGPALARVCERIARLG